MNNGSQTANPNFFEELTAENSAILLIDHQVNLLLGVQTMDHLNLLHNIVMLAQTGKKLNIPTLITTSGAEGPNGILFPEIKKIFPDHEVIDRTIINAWNDKNFVKAVEATGRKNLIIASISTDVCLAFPAISAVRDGYNVHAVLDASGTWNSLKEQAAISRMAQAGVIMNTWATVAAEIGRDWALPTAVELGELLGGGISFWGIANEQFNARNALRA